MQRGKSQALLAITTSSNLGISIKIWEPALSIAWLNHAVHTFLDFWLNRISVFVARASMTKVRKISLTSVILKGRLLQI